MAATNPVAFPSLPSTAALGLPPGTILGDKYRIDGLLGVGGMGVVQSATHLVLGSPVAIKVVRDELARHEAVVARLIFEARAAASLHSVHIVRVLDVARLPSGAPYIVMEHLRGKDLSRVLQERGRLPMREAIGYVLQACEGLAEAHALRIIHRDLKPENLFLARTPEGVTLKILDFGISKEVGPGARRGGNRPTLSREGVGAGSPSYMAPEQMRAAPTLDERADLWSLGAILFELLTGRCPFEAETAAALACKVMVEDPPFLLGLMPDPPAALEDIVRRCLQKNPDDRFANVNELSGALRRFLVDHDRPREVELDIPIDEEPVSAPRASRWGLSLLVFGLTLAAGSAAVWYGRTHGFHAPSWLAQQPAAAVARQLPALASVEPEPDNLAVSAPPPEGVAAPQEVPVAAEAASAKQRPKPPPGGWKWPPEPKRKATEAPSTRYGL